MKKFTTICIAVAAALALAGCGKTGPGASAETSAGMDVEQKLSIEKHKSLEKKTDAKITATIPASVSISDAAFEIWGSSNKLDSVSKPLRVLAKAPASFSLLTGCETLADLQLRTAGLLLIAHQSRSGWDIDPEGEPLKRFFLFSASSVEFASRIEALVASNLSIAADPAAARAAAKAALLTLSESDIRTQAAEAVAVAKRALEAGIDPDLATGKGIGITAGGAKYSADPSGWMIERQGVKWFGQGFAEGREYKIALESSVSKSIGKKESFESHQDAKQGASDKASTRVE